MALSVRGAGQKGAAERLAQLIISGQAQRRRHSDQRKRADADFTGGHPDRVEAKISRMVDDVLRNNLQSRGKCPPFQLQPRDQACAQRGINFVFETHIQKQTLFL